MGASIAKGLQRRVAQITTQLAEIRERVARAAMHANRAPESVTIVAVSKAHGAEAIAEACAAGQRDFGESYLQEALPKLAALEGKDIIWHFIGRLQANKTRSVAERFAWVHTVDREKLAARLNDQRPHFAPPLNVLVQVNLANEPGKGGVAAGAVEPLARAVASLPRLAFRGLMMIPPADLRENETRALYRELAALGRHLSARGIATDTLSIGMSDDFELAIEAGSTCVRIGTAIFGRRGA